MGVIYYQAGHGEAGHGGARHGKAGRGGAWHGWAGQGRARQGKACFLPGVIVTLDIQTRWRSTWRHLAGMMSRDHLESLRHDLIAHDGEALRGCALGEINRALARLDGQPEEEPQHDVA